MRHPKYCLLIVILCYGFKISLREHHGKDQSQTYKKISKFFLMKPIELDSKPDFCEIYSAEFIVWVFCGIFFLCQDYFKAAVRQSADIGLDGER